MLSFCGTSINLPDYTAINLITHTQIGTHHTDHNEDAFLTAEITDRHLLLAVMDGSSGGTDSHFAAGLIAKVLRRIAKQTNLRSFAERTQHTTADLLKNTLRTLLADLARLSSDLDLGHDELLSSLMLAIVDTQDRHAEIVVIGDGVIACDEEIIEFDPEKNPIILVTISTKISMITGTCSPSGSRPPTSLTWPWRPTGCLTSGLLVTILTARSPKRS